MEKAKVYFADMRATFEETIPQKLARLLTQEQAEERKAT